MQEVITIDDRSEQFKDQRGIFTIEDGKIEVISSKKSGQNYHCYTFSGTMKAIDPIYAKLVEFKVSINADTDYGIFFVNLV